ncbi:MAG: type III secretion system inner membrane ring subunit SctD [Chlamydiia bacterium]|nr:type III secretion system inner membrane ring subunit SctD [Chlamydiia bacterium]
MSAHLIAEEGPHQDLILNLEERDHWTIGRDPDESSFVIEDASVSRKAAELTRTPEGFYFKNLSRTNPALVNDVQADDPVLLREGDRILIGRTVFRFSEAPLSEDAGLPSGENAGEYDDIFSALEEPPEELPSQPLKEIGASSEPSRENRLEETDPLPLSERSAYDTIFEDTGGEEALPFNLLSDTPFLLKVISGPNAGAEISLEKGRSYTIGKDAESCEITFQDLSVSRNHARLTVSSEGIMEIEDLGSRNGTIVNGTPIAEKRTITPQDLIALGTTVFLIIDREAPQETIYSPILSTYEPPNAESAVEEAPPLPKPLEKPRDWKKEPIPTKYLIVATSFAAIFLIVFLSFFSLFKSNPVEVARKEPIDQIKKALAKFPSVQLSFNPASGKLFLVGHVLTAVEYQEMRYRIGEITFITSTEENVVIDEYVDKSMNDILSNNATFRGVTIQSPKPAKFIAVGYVETNDQAALLSEYLAVNFPYLDKLENRVIVGENINTEIQGLLLMKGFGALSFQYSNGELILAGNYSNKMTHEFNDLTHQFSTLQGINAVKNYAVATDPNAAAIDVSQQFQVSGVSQFEGSGYSVVLNGKIFTLGDAVSGMVITAIAPTTILLEKDGIKYKINYTR